MLTYLLGFFVLVMAGGAALAALEHRGRALPLKLSVWHGILGIVAIVLLVLQAMAHPANHPINVAIIIFMLAALGGLLLLAFRASKQRLPLAVVAMHGGFATAALILLVIGWMRG